MTKDPKRRPFVIVEHEGTGHFVQFAGSAAEKLLLDNPSMQVQMHFDTVSAAVLDVEQIVENVWALGDDEPVTITEDENKPFRKELTKKAREFLDKLGEKLRSIIPEPLPELG
jgi:hypothetical protein